MSLVLAVLLSGLVASCASDIAGPDAMRVRGATKADALRTRVYRLNVGDKVRIRVFGENNLSGDFEVSALGAIAMPLLGELPAKGRSVAEFRRGLSKRLADGYLKEPRVTVEVLNYRGFYVHGEVRSAGEFKYKPGLALSDAIAVAGGYTYRANKSVLYIKRQGSNEALRVALPSNIPVLPGDNIRIPERFF